LASVEAVALRIVRMERDAHRLNARDLWAIGAAASLFILHALSFGTWIVDDAGISLAYARNLARGYGLVSQPGVPPVEGYSNPLWVGLMSLLFELRIVDPVITLKTIGVMFVTLSFAVTYATVLELSGEDRSVSLLVVLCLALNTPFVVWAVSGLENPLYVFLVSSMLALAIRGGGISDVGEPVWFALLAIGVALTRPDGILYGAAYPIVALARGHAEHHSPQKVGRNVVLYLAVFGLVTASLLGFRLFYFGDLLPNTYYAKGGPSVANLFAEGKLDGLIDRVTGFGGGLWLLFGAVVTLVLVRSGKTGWRHFISLLFLCVSVLVFLLLPADGFPEFRFASPFFVLFYGYVLVTIRLLLGNAAWSVTAVAVIAATAVLNLGPSRRFAKDPPVPFTRVEKQARRFDHYAATLQITGGSALTPDLGAMLYHSRLRIFDLGMLCDRTIARTLGKNPRALYDYVFEEVKPTFIHTHDLWTALAWFDNDPRFRRDYVALREWTGDAWIYEPKGIRMLRSGDYVRRDAIGERGDLLRQVQLGAAD